jgi:hypothetical protein
MKPYFGTSHVAGLLLLIASPGWGATEAAPAGNRQLPRWRTYRPAGRRISP